MANVLTVSAVAAQFDVSRRMIYRAIAAGELRAFRLGKLLRIKREDADAWFEKHCTLPVAGNSDDSRDAGSAQHGMSRASVRAIVSMPRRARREAKRAP